MSALYSGINGTLAGDLQFPGVAFTVMQELPDPPSQPIQIPSGNLNPVALDSLHLKATLPPPARARLGFPEWLGNLQSGARILEFTYVDPNIEVGITDTFYADLDGISRTFITSTTLATDGQQAAITITGDMVGGWARPFGIDWLTLDTIGLAITGDGTAASATLHSTFELGSKNIALEMGISGSASNQLVRFSGTVDSLSLSDFIELARKHLGAQADPFGDSNFDFTFTNVRMNIETGTRSSFSLGGETTLKGKPTDVLFSAIPRPGGGLPQIITGFQMQDWSLADALDELKGTFVEDFRLDTAALVFSKGEGSTQSEDMDPETRAL